MLGFKLGGVVGLLYFIGVVFFVVMEVIKEYIVDGFFSKWCINFVMKWKLIDVRVVE